jgi:hypothetical protein
VDHGDEILLLEQRKRKTTQLIAGLAILIDAKASPRELRFARRKALQGLSNRFARQSQQSP